MGFAPPQSAVRAAICRQPCTERLSECISMDIPQDPIDVVKAHAEHAEYVAALKSLVPEVIVLPPDEQYPDSVFVEDTCTVIGQRALVHNLGAESRKGEVSEMRPVLERLGLEVHMMRAPATADGGDVLFTGSEIFVGLSRRTNAPGVDAIRAAFPQYPVTAIPVDVGGLHLKSFVTMAGPNTLVFSGDAIGQRIKEAMAPAERGYGAVTVPDAVASNCVRVGSALLVMAGFPASLAVYQSLGAPVVPVRMAELAKADGGLTCQSVLIPSL